MKRVKSELPLKEALTVIFQSRDVRPAHDGYLPDVATLPAPSTPVWLEDEEVQNDADSDDEAPPSLGNIMASVDAIYDKYISVKPDGKLTN